MLRGDEVFGKREQAFKAEMFEEICEEGLKQWRERKIERLTYKGKRKRQRFPTADLTTCTLVREYGETSPRCTVHISSPTGHVGRHRRAVSLFTGTSSSSSLGACVMDQTSDIGTGHRHLLSRSAWWSGRESGPCKWTSRDACVETRIYERPSQGVSSCMGCV